MRDDVYRAKVQKIVDILAEDERIERERSALRAANVRIAPGVSMTRVGKAATPTPPTGPTGTPWRSDMNDAPAAVASQQAVDAAARKQTTDTRLARVRAELEKELAGLGPYDGGNRTRIKLQLEALGRK
jgi:hypothetical protein